MDFPVIVREIALEDTNRMPIKIRLFPRRDRKYSIAEHDGDKHGLKQKSGDVTGLYVRHLSFANDIDNNCDVNDDFWEKPTKMAAVRSRVRFADMAPMAEGQTDRKPVIRPGMLDAENRKSDSQFLNSTESLARRGGGEGKGRFPLHLHNQRMSAFELKEMEKYSEIHFLGEKVNYRAYTCMHACIQIYICTKLHARPHVHTFIHTHTYTHTCTREYKSCICW